MNVSILSVGVLCIVLYAEKRVQHTCSQGGLPCVQDYQDCSDSVELRRHRQALQAQALDCLAESARSAVPDNHSTALSASSAQQPALLLGSAPSAEMPSSFDIEQGTDIPTGNRDVDQETSEWQLTAESRSGSARGVSSLVFINPKALFKALNRYSMAVTDRLTGTLQHTHSSDGPQPIPGSADVHSAAGHDGVPQDQEGSAQQMCRSMRLLASARCLLLQQVQVLEGLARERGYSESLLHSDSPTENEEYTNRHALVLCREIGSSCDSHCCQGQGIMPLYKALA